jgi:peptidase M23-like protein
VRGRRVDVMRLAVLWLAVPAVASAATLVAAPAGAVGDGGHGFGRMGPTNARTTAVSPASGPDFEMPFVCGEQWTGTTRGSHSPSAYTVDWNTPDDLGKKAVASAPGVVIKAVSLKDSYGNYVVIDHGGGFTTLYAHLRNISTTVGTFLDQGDLVGRVGATGNVTGPHLHFEERKDGAYFPPYFHRATYSFGTTAKSANCGDRPISGDWNGDGRGDIGVYRSTPTGSEFRLQKPGSVRAFVWGAPSDTPFVGDWNGDGVTEVGRRTLGTTVFTKRLWNATSQNVNGVGSATDGPLTGDWNADGVDDLGVYRAANHTFYLRQPNGSLSPRPWGAAGDRGLTGDWNGDGHVDLGTFNPLTGVWTLRKPTGSTYVTRKITFGTQGDLPLAGDWNGDGIDELTVWRPRNATFYMRSPTPSGGYVTKTLVFGNKR